MNPGKLFQKIGHSVATREKGIPFLIGIDGAAGSGKTMFAKAFTEHLRDMGEHVIEASVDGFHNERATRYRQGRNSAVGYYEDAFNYQLMIDRLLGPIKMIRKTCQRVAFDCLNDREHLQIEDVMPDSILVMEGVFLFRPVLGRYWDMKIFLDVGHKEIMSRVVSREKDQKALGSFTEIKKVYEKRYIPAQHMYYDEVHPKEQADVVIDNNDYGNPILVSNHQII